MKTLKKISTELIENWFCVGSVVKGHWTNPVYELFSPKENGIPIHIHIYIENDYKGSTFQRVLERIPNSIKTFSSDY